MNHQRAMELLPWLVNGTLADGERAALERHVHDCIPCRAELQQQSALAALVQRQGNVHMSADAGFEDLMRHIDTPRVPQRPGWVRYAVAASVAVALVGVATMTVYVSTVRDDGRFATLGAPADKEVLRLDIIFVDGVDEDEMREVLRGVSGRIVAGPSDLGRYTIEIEAAGHSGDDAADELDALRRDARIRFAGPSFIPPKRR